MKKDVCEKSRMYSIFDASFYSAMVGFGESSLAAFAVFLRATSFQLGILKSFPRMFGARKRVVVLGVILQALISRNLLGINRTLALFLEVTFRPLPTTS